MPNLAEEPVFEILAARTQSVKTRKTEQIMDIQETPHDHAERIRKVYTGANPETPAEAYLRAAIERELPFKKLPNETPGFHSDPLHPNDPEFLTAAQAEKSFVVPEQGIGHVRVSPNGVPQHMLTVDIKSCCTMILSSTGPNGTDAVMVHMNGNDIGKYKSQIDPIIENMSQSGSGKVKAYVIGGNASYIDSQALVGSSIEYLREKGATIEGTHILDANSEALKATKLAAKLTGDTTELQRLNALHAENIAVEVTGEGITLKKVPESLAPKLNERAIQIIRTYPDKTKINVVKEQPPNAFRDRAPAGSKPTGTGAELTGEAKTAALQKMIESMPEGAAREKINASLNNPEMVNKIHVYDTDDIGKLFEKKGGSKAIELPGTRDRVRAFTSYEDGKIHIGTGEGSADSKIVAQALREEMTHLETHGQVKTSALRMAKQFGEYVTEQRQITGKSGPEVMAQIRKELGLEQYRGADLPREVYDHTKLMKEDGSWQKLPEAVRAKYEKFSNAVGQIEVAKGAPVKLTPAEIAEWQKAFSIEWHQRAYENKAPGYKGYGPDGIPLRLIKEGKIQKSLMDLSEFVVYDALRKTDYSQRPGHDPARYAPEIASITGGSTKNMVAWEDPGVNGWHFRRSNTNDLKAPVLERASLNVFPDEVLIQKLDALCQRHNAYYKTPYKAEGWVTRHDPVTIYFHEPITQNIKNDLIDTFSSHTRGDDLIGERIGKGISIIDNPNKASITALLERARVLDETHGTTFMEAIQNETHGKFKLSAAQERSHLIMVESFEKFVESRTAVRVVQPPDPVPVLRLAEQPVRITPPVEQTPVRVTPNQPVGGTPPAGAKPSRLGALANAEVVGGGMAVAFGGVQLYNSVKHGDVVDGALGVTNVGAGAVGIAANLAPGALKVVGLGKYAPEAVGKAAGGVMLAAGIVSIGYEAYKEQGTGKDDKLIYQVARGASGASAFGAGMAAGHFAANVSGGYGWIVAPVAGIVVGMGVGMAGNKLIEDSKAEKIEAKAKLAAEQTKSSDGQKMAELQDAVGKLSRTGSKTGITNADIYPDGKTGQLALASFSDKDGKFGAPELKMLHEKAEAALKIAKLTGNESYAQLGASLQALENMASKRLGQLGTVQGQDPSINTRDIANQIIVASGAARSGSVMSSNAERVERGAMATVDPGQPMVQISGGQQQTTVAQAQTVPQTGAGASVGRWS